MSKATQALLWAAVIFPGAGHLYLNHFKRGIALVAISLLILSLMFFRFSQQMHNVLDKDLADGRVLDLQNLQHIISMTLQASAADFSLLSGLWVLLLCWLVGMIDAYRLGKKMEK